MITLWTDGDVHRQYVPAKIVQLAMSSIETANIARILATTIEYVDAVLQQYTETTPSGRRVLQRDARVRLGHRLPPETPDAQCAKPVFLDARWLQTIAGP